MEFTLKGLEVVKLRNKSEDVCWDWQNYDSMVINDIMDSEKCRPTYWDSKQDHPICSKQEQWKSISERHFANYKQLHAYGRIIPPCIELKNMEISYKENDGEVLKDYWSSVRRQLENTLDKGEKWFGINVLWLSATDFKEIKAVRAYSTQSVIGNAGGYVGLLVGYTVSRIPLFLFAMCVAVKKLGSRRTGRVARERSAQIEGTKHTSGHGTGPTDETIDNKIQRINERLDSTILYVDNKFQALENS